MSLFEERSTISKKVNNFEKTQQFQKGQQFQKKINNFGKRLTTLKRGH
jgi:hypothetical protein